MKDNPQTDALSNTAIRTWMEAAGILAVMGKHRQPAREILSANVRKLMGYRGPSERSDVPQNFLAGRGASQSTIWRIINAETGARLETLDAIAAFFALPSTWQLLVPELDKYPRTGPELKSPNDTQAELLRRVQKVVSEMQLAPEQAQSLQGTVNPPAVPTPDRMYVEVMTRIAALVEAHGFDKLINALGHLDSAGPEQESRRAPDAVDSQAAHAQIQSRQKKGRK